MTPSEAFKIVLDLTQKAAYPTSEQSEAIEMVKEIAENEFDDEGE